MSKVTTSNQETLEPVLDIHKINSEVHFSEISSGLYTQISEAFLKAQKTGEGIASSLSVCCVQACCVSKCCVQIR